VYKHLLVPTDGSQLSVEAIKHGVAFAKDAGAKISFLTVTEPFHTISFEADQLEATASGYQKYMADRAARCLAEAAKLAKDAGISFEELHVVDDQPYRAIIHTAEAKGCDLIVMGSHGRRGISAIVLGSVTVKVLTHSTIPVLVYRLPRAPAQRRDSARQTDALVDLASMP
jgi:nucleotide-binding universal stress UspA family protein